jgi:YihY family inner membrane protein
MKAFDGAIRRVDQVQRRHTWLAFPVAVFKKFGEDQGSNLSALIAYYGFLSLFPLMLVFVSVLGIVLRNNEDLQRRILETALSNFPVIGTQIGQNVHALAGNGVVLAVGIVVTLWAGLGVTAAAQTAMNRVWAVPRTRWPNFFASRLRGLAVLVFLGTLIILTSLLSGLGVSGVPSIVFQVLWIAASLVLNLGLFVVAFRILTARALSTGEVFPGAVVAAVLWTSLQSLGGYLITHQIANATDVYGTFALVIGLLFWLYLGAEITVMSAEINAVRAKRLWPRSLVEEPPHPGADPQAAGGDAVGYS